MKRVIFISTLCLAVLAAEATVFLRASSASESTSLMTEAELAEVFKTLPLPPPKKEGLIAQLLKLPAPPPPNPLETVRQHDASFFDPKKPPPDDAPIDDLIDYWSKQADDYRGVLYYASKPSDRVVARLLAEGGADAAIAVLRVLPDDERTVSAIKRLYDDAGANPATKAQLKSWLLENSGFFSNDLERNARKLKDSNNYVNISDQGSLLALVRHDWDAARPLVDRMYADRSQPVTQALATWALYRHALETSSVGDTDRYRSELMAIVENRSLTDGTRDMANDALVREPDFPGRDEWCWSLFEDETLVNMPRFTGLTTVIMYSPPDKYVAKMTELLESKNKLVRKMAVRNLLVAFGREKSPEIARALLPWLSDAHFAEQENEYGRLSYVQYLAQIKLPESVPALIAALDESEKRPAYSSNSAGAAANAMRSAANAMAAAVNAAARAAGDASVETDGPPPPTKANAASVKMETVYPLRSAAIAALAKQADSRAVPALRRLLASTTDIYPRRELLTAIFRCGGFSVEEQVDAIEQTIRKQVTITAEIEAKGIDPETNQQAYAAEISDKYQLVMSDRQVTIATIVIGDMEPAPMLVQALLNRCEALQEKEPKVAQIMRGIFANWKGPTVSAILLRDLKMGRAELGAVIRLLTDRKMLREQMSSDVVDSRNGSPVASAIGACILDDEGSYDEILDSGNAEAKTALFACGRMVRAKVPVARAIDDLKSTNAELKTAAELYLESEDSPAARSAVLAMHPGEAKILGATDAFGSNATGGAANYSYYYVQELFASVTGQPLDRRYREPSAMASLSGEPLRKELKEDKTLTGIYALDDNTVRIYSDRVVFTWGDDPARFYERTLRPEEFSALKRLLVDHDVTNLKPFLVCGTRGCGTMRQFVMLGAAGGSRIYTQAYRTPQLFVDLDKLFEEFRAEPAVVKYALAKDVPGLEVLAADDDFDARTVWKSGDDIRVAGRNVSVSETADEEAPTIEESASDDEKAPTEDTYDEDGEDEADLRDIEWRKIENGSLAGVVPQPSGVEYVPLADGATIKPGKNQWKGRATGFEIRIDEDGAHKIAGTAVTKIGPGYFGEPVISADGKWLVVEKLVNDNETQLVRHNMLTNRDFPIRPAETYPQIAGICYVSSLRRFLVRSGYYYSDDYEGDADGDRYGNKYYLLDGETGVMTATSGEIRPLVQQTFRPLQPTSRANESWAAIPNSGKNQTMIGIYDSRLFRLTPVVTLPKIIFNSMAMWVDEAEGKIYFTYKGQLLRVPLKPAVTYVEPASTPTVPPRRAADPK